GAAETQQLGRNAGLEAMGPFRPKGGWEENGAPACLPRMSRAIAPPLRKIEGCLMARSPKNTPAVTQKRTVASRRDPEPSYGSAMGALPEKWRLAVEHLFLANGNQTEALRRAGYVATADSLKRMATRIFRDDRVRAAVREEVGRHIDVSEPE